MQKYTVMNETFPKRFQNVFVPVLDLVSKNAIFGKLKALSARGYMSHTLVLENLPATKWSRYPWSTQLGSLGVWLYPGVHMPVYGHGVHPGTCIDKVFLMHF